MIIKWLLSFTLLLLGVLFLSSVDWFDAKRFQTEQITRDYRNNIQELKNIEQTTRWLHDVVIPNFLTTPLAKSDAELDMIHFYDRYSKTYNFKVSQFIYYDNAAKMDIGFSFDPKSQKDIEQFLSLHYPNGFLQIQKFASKEGTIEGIVTIIQPMQGDVNASGQ